ncbi:hypothetical protein VSS37_03765 [Candidatus Thiothrix sp. Deng01]|uniref:Uncharacterized protein n=1 Tax=Candidatus Thiothrix phosphatis TaxID=3112415 RepID=A0ABU6CVL0_9GAMM|nr:hypothetical protein [Candidatus Thiothrix sp. Deng01]MEB4590088.1 hypothetical protein [Candidatus Thiothrix sp. Deng01]
MHPYHSHGCVVAPVAPPPVAKPVMTRAFTLHDYCEFAVVGAEGECTVNIPVDPNTGQKARYVVFTPVKGDYVVSLNGATNFDHLGTNAPLLNPIGFGLDDLADFRLYSMGGCFLKICWYLDIPCGVKADRPPYQADAHLGFSTASRDATI